MEREIEVKLLDIDIKDFEEKIIRSIGSLDNVLSINKQDLQVEAGLKFIDNICSETPIIFSITEVRYDEKNRLWKVNKSNLFAQGGFVIIEQDTGKIVRALLNKN